LKQRLLQAVDSAWAQSIIAGFLGLFAHLDTCAAALAVVALIVQVGNGLHKRKILYYKEKMAKMDYDEKRACMEKEMDNG